MKQMRIAALLLAAVLAGSTGLGSLPVRAAEAVKEPETLLAETELTEEELEENRFYYENDGEALKYLNPDGTWRSAADGEEALVGDPVSEQLIHDRRFDGYTRHYGIDVSYHANQNQAIDWKKVRAAGREFAIIRVGYRAYGSSGTLNEDRWWKRNLEGALEAGLKVGVYLYSQAITKAEAVEEADWLMNRVASYRDRLTMGYVMDYEYADNGKDKIGRLYQATAQATPGGLTKADLTEIARAFCERVAAQKLQPMIYADTSFLTGSLNASELDQTYPIWMARYRKAGADYPGNYQIWQYSASVRVDGIPNPECDADVWYEKPGEAIDLPEQLTGSEARRMYRLYNPNSGEHLYTKSREETELLIKAGWKYEGTAWYAPVKTEVPVYRLYNPNAGDHHYTTSALERENLVKVGWNDEGIGWYSAAKEDGVALYRLYNQNAVTGTHHYTRSDEERRMLVKAGWNDEGIGWYGVNYKE